MHRRLKQLPDRAVRCLAWLCLFLTLWPGFVVAANAPAPAAVPVVTNISGAVAVHNANGTSRDILSSQIIHSGDMLVTGVDSLALVSLADVGKVRLGPASTATALATGSSLSIRIASGSLCVESQSRAIRIEAGVLAVAAGDDSTVFNLIRASDATKIAVYQGHISTSLGGKRSSVVNAGEAVVSSHGGNPVSVPIQTVQADFASLKCPDEALIARAVPSPTPGAPSSGGGGGGGAGGILGILLGLGAIAAAVGHGGGGGGSPPTSPPAPTPTPTQTPPGALKVVPTSLTFTALGAANSQTFVASESNYAGVISVGGNNPSTATVSPASGNSGQTFTVTPVAAGSTTITVTDDHGGSVPVSVNVAPPGALKVNPSTLAFNNGSSAAQPFTVSETNYTGTFFINDISCSGIVSVTPPSGTGPGQVFSAAPQSAGGPCSIGISDDHGGLQTLTVRVFAPPSVAPSSLQFSDVGLSNAQSVTVSETNPNYFGTFSIANDSCPGIATVGPPAGTGPTTTVPVVASASNPSGGACSFRVKDDVHGGLSGLINVTVGPFGPVAPSPTTMTFTDVGAGAAKTFTVSESGYTGNFSINATACSGVATVSPSSGNSSTTFTVTPVGGGGPCNVSVSDDHTQTASVSVTVGPFGAVLPSPTSLNLTVGGANGTFTVSESGYTGSFTTNAAACAGFATVTGSSPTFNVAAVAPGNCAIVVSDDHTQSAKVFVFVTSGSLTVTPTTLQFANSGSPPQTFTATDPSATTIFVSSSDTTIAIVSPAFLPGPSATFTVSPGINTGKAFITVTDNIAGSTAVVSIGVGVPPLIKKRAPISLHNRVPTPKSTASPSPPPRRLPPEPHPVGPDSPRGTVPVLAGPLNVSAANIMSSPGVAGQPITVSEQGYSRFFTASTSNAAVATVNVSVATGPTATFAIVAHDPGVAVIRFADDHGGVRMVTVSVREPLRAGPRAPGKAQPL